jgi:hypothetical protein
MAEKNHGIWSDRPAVQKAFDTRSFQDLYQAVNAVITPEQAAQLETILFPPLRKEEQIASLQQVREALEKHGLDPKEVDAKISALRADENP